MLSPRGWDLSLTRGVFLEFKIWRQKRTVKLRDFNLSAVLGGCDLDIRDGMAEKEGDK